MCKNKPMPFESIFCDDTRNALKIQKKDYLEKGKYPIIDQGQAHVAGYTNNNEKIYTSVPTIIFGDHTRIIKYTDTPFFLGADGAKILASKDKQNNIKYLYYLIKNLDIPNTGYNRHYKWLKEKDIATHDYNEQERIANILDQANLIIQKRKESLQLADDYIKSVFLEMFGDPVTNPMGWDMKKLGDLSYKITDGVHAKPNYTEEGMPFISVVNITKGFVDFKNCKCVSHEDFLKMTARTKPEKGDILYTKVGATYGIPAYVDIDDEFCLYVSVALIKPKHHEINSKFLSFSMGMPYIKRQADKKIKGIGVPDLHLNQIKEFFICCPPSDLQNKFVQIIEQVEKTKEKMQIQLNEAETLFSALQQEFFG